MSLQLTELVKRPAVGDTGKPIRVRSNFFVITAFANQSIHHYDVTIEPAIKNPTLIDKIWQTFKETSSQGILAAIKVVFDGGKNVFSPEPLDLGEAQNRKFEVALPNGRRPSGEVFSIRIKKANEIDMEELRNFLTGQTPCTANILTAIMVFDIILRHVPSSMYKKIGRSFYSPNDKRSLPNGAEVWKGYYQSARPTPGKMMINIDVTATVLGRRSLDELRRGFSDFDMINLKKVLEGLRVCIVHRGDGRINQTITDLTPLPVSQTSFKDEEGNEMSIADYFLNQYNKRLNYPFLPCVTVETRKDKKIYYPMEVCEVLPGQRVKKKLNEKQTTEMIKFTCQKPSVCANKIIEGMNILKYRENTYMQQFGINVNPVMAVVNARVLPTPKISFQEAEFAPQGGAWNMRAIERFIRELCRTFIDHGVNVINRQPPIISADPNGNIELTLEQAWLKAGNSAYAEPQIMMCILPNTGVPFYAEIKRISDTIIGIPTQCVQSKKQYCANVCLKVNVKLGGKNFYLTPPYIPFIAERRTIIIGADVSHPAPGDVNHASIAALAASLDARASRYCSCMRVQTSRTEIITDLANMVKEVLQNYSASCGQKPERILFYRDGISEDEFKKLLDCEVAAIRAACASLGRLYRPTITFVVAQKRHHARFFAIKSGDADRTGNLMPGTIVDTGVVHPSEFDFYLQSHAGLQGTCRPTHYHVLYDENKFTSNSLQELTYNLCYCYARATRSVSLVPGVYYADLIAARGRLYYRESSNDTDATAGLLDSDTQMPSYPVVQPGLQNLMHFF